jgi:hypothetical protein
VIETGDKASLRQIYAQNAVQVEHPNRLKPKGDRREIERDDGRSEARQDDAAERTL